MPPAAGLGNFSFRRFYGIYRVKYGETGGKTLALT
jgi:hypothetical protein